MIADNMMTSLGLFVGEGNWTFFHEIYEDLASHFQVEVYHQRTVNTPLLHGRLNRWLFRHGIQSVLNRNEVCFFEWASDLLVAASHMPKRSKIVTRLHSFELFEWAPKINWDAVDKVILVSQTMQKRFCELYPHQADKTCVVYNGVDLSRFKPPDKRDFSFRIGMLCNILPIKRVYEVILSLNELRKGGYGASLHIAGEPKGDYRYAQAVQRLVDELGLQDAVTFYGRVDETTAWLQNIDIFVSNSYWEGQQVALIEALACGCYCLSHFWAGVEEVLPQENIYDTEAEMISKIIEFYKLPEGLKFKSQKQMRDIALQKFDLEKTKLQIRQVIEQVVN